MRVKVVMGGAISGCGRAGKEEKGMTGEKKYMAGRQHSAIGNLLLLI